MKKMKRTLKDFQSKVNSHSVLSVNCYVKITGGTENNSGGIFKDKSKAKTGGG